jgi:hypothetical protein
MQSETSNSHWRRAVTPNESEAVDDAAPFERDVLDLWFEGSHYADPRERDAEAKSKGVANRDQVTAVVQALEANMAVVQALEAAAANPTSVEPINELTRAFLLSSNPTALIPSSPKLIALIPPSPTPNAEIPPSVTQDPAIVVRYSKKKADRRVKVSIVRNSNSSECDVVVAIRDRKVVVRLPDYGLAVKWAQMELRSYGLPPEFVEEAPLDREPDHELGE